MLHVKYFILGVSFFLFGCGSPGNYDKDLTLLNSPTGVAKNAELNINISGLDDFPLVFLINDDTYTVYNNGTFTHKLSEFYTLTIDADPEGKRCAFFDYDVPTSTIDNIAECNPSDIEYQNTSVQIGRWKYFFSGERYVIYSSEENVFEKRDSNDTESGYEVIPTNNSGLFFDDNRIGNEASYATDEIPIVSGGAIKIQEYLKDMVLRTPDSISILETYNYNALPAVSVEYKVSFSKAKSAMTVVRNLAKQLKYEAGAIAIKQLPSEVNTAVLDTDFMIAIKTFSPDNGSVFYQFEAKPLKLMPSGTHFPTMIVKTSE